MKKMGGDDPFEFMIYPKRKKAGSENAVMYLRISYQIYVCEKSLGIEINYNDWDPSRQRITYQELNNYRLDQKIREYQTKLSGAYFMLSKFDGQFTLKEIIATAFGSDKKPAYSLFNVFEQEMNQILKGLKPGQSNAYAKKHHVCLQHLKKFVLQQYHIKDLAFSRINPDFIKKFIQYMKSDAGNSHNSTMKMLQIFKKVYQVAVNNRWVAYNAFAGMRFTFEDIEPESLTSDEIKVLTETEMPNERLSKSRDIFLFGCYSGLAYVDLMSLQRKHIEFNPSSQIYFIKKKRTKTGKLSVIPLFKPAQDLLVKWWNGWEDLSPEEKLLPQISNQKYNDYLKDVANVCGIQKNVISHMARHSFATSVALENGVTLESTAKMMGHTKITQTQKYAKVTELKIAMETDKLFKMLNK